MSTRMDDLPLILGFTVVAFVLGATTPVIVQRLEPEPARPAVQPEELQDLREAIGALGRTVGDLSRTVNGVATDVDKLRAELASARQLPQPEPPPAPSASVQPSPERPSTPTLAVPPSTEAPPGPVPDAQPSAPEQP